MSSPASLPLMFRFLSRTISPTTPKLVSSLNNPCSWLPLRFISNTTASSTSTSSRSKGNSFVVSYLTGTCGFSPERAIVVSKNLAFENAEKPDLVIEFFKNHGFPITTALSVVRSAPLLLRANPQKTLQPKIDFFKSIGFSTSEICKIIVPCPLILTRSLHSEIIPSFDFFNNLFQSKSRLMKAVIGHSGILYGFDKVSAPNIKIMREEGIPEPHIVRFVEYFPRTLKSCPKQFRERVREVKELKFNPLRLQFVVAVHVKACLGSSWARKEAIYKKWGWSDDDILAAFRVSPWCMAVKVDKIEAGMDYLVNKLGYTPSAIARLPEVLTMSLEKRIIPRGSVILALMSRGLVNELSLSAIFKCNEIDFLNRFVHRHVKEADELLKSYQAKSALA